VKASAEDPAGRDEEGDWEVEVPWKIGDPLPDGRRSQAVLDTLQSTDEGRRVPDEEDALSEVSEAELWESQGEPGTGAEAGCWGDSTVPPHAGLHCVGRRRLDSFIFPFICLRIFLGAPHIFLGQAWAEGEKRCLQRTATARTADRKRTVHNLTMI